MNAFKLAPQTYAAKKSSQTIMAIRDDGVTGIPMRLKPLHPEGDSDDVIQAKYMIWLFKGGLQGVVR